jgi:hypothetical protein
MRKLEKELLKGYIKGKLRKDLKRIKLMRKEKIHLRKEAKKAQVLRRKF